MCLLALFPLLLVFPLSIHNAIYIYVTLFALLVVIQTLVSNGCLGFLGKVLGLLGDVISD
jgi:hypothetical protein